jgi:CheY-like chemotaxis protein
MTENKSTILIIDDEIVSRYTIEALLESDRYTLVFAENGVQGLEKAQAIEPALILLDVMMPGMNGFAVCRKLRADPRFVNTPVIMITAWDDETARQRCLEVGAYEVICKPFNRVELHAKVENFIKKQS